jgi:plastocyanin
MASMIEEEGFFVVKLPDLNITKTNMQMLVNLFNNKNKKDEDGDHDHVGRGTKIKVISALLIVGFAVYVAWWVQEPVGVKADTLENPATEETIAEGDTQTEEAQLTQEVSIESFTFVPQDVEVEKGTTVTWVNRDTVPHTVTGDSFSSGTLDLGQAYSYTFNEDGTYDYHCAFYPAVKGTVIVGTGINPDAVMSEETMAPMEEPMFDEPVEPTASVDDVLPDMSAETMEAVTLSPDELMAEAAADEVHGSAEESDKLASSGPEDFLYLGAFLAILFMQRRRLFPLVK